VADIQTFLTTFTAGSVPTWITAVMMCVVAWRGVPGFLNALARGFELIALRQSAVESRLSAMLNDQAVRFDSEISSLRQQHADCLARDEIKSQRITALEDTVRELKDANASLRRTWAQQQESTVAVLPGSLVSQDIQAATLRGAGHRDSKS
jgi:hypothetical protein